MLNKVMIIGRLGRDPELRYSQSGSPVCTLNIATDESYTDRDGNRVDRAEWHRVVVFQKAAENCSQYLTKGSLVFVEGSLQTRKWQDQQGQDRYTTEIKAQRVQFLDKRGGEQGGMPSGAGGSEGGYSAPRRPAQPGGGKGELFSRKFPLSLPKPLPRRLTDEEAGRSSFRGTAGETGLPCLTQR